MTITVFETSKGARAETSNHAVQTCCVFFWGSLQLRSTYGLIFIQFLLCYIHIFIISSHHQKKSASFGDPTSNNPTSNEPMGKKKTSLQTGAADEPMVGISNRSLGLAGGVGSWGRSLEGGKVWCWDVRLGVDQLSDQLKKSVSILWTFQRIFS